MTKQIQINSIGTIRSPVSEQQTGGFTATDSLIQLNPEFAEYLDGILEYSHLHIIYWLSEMTDIISTTRPQGNHEVPVVGMFACR